MQNASVELEKGYQAVLTCRHDCMDNQIPINNITEIDSEMKSVEHQIAVELQKTTDELRKIEEEETEAEETVDELKVIK